MIYGIIKYSSSSELKSTLFTEGGESISYAIIVVSLNGVDVISSWHGIKLRGSELWIKISGYFQRSKEYEVNFYSMERWELYSSNQTWWDMCIINGWYGLK